MSDNILYCSEKGLNNFFIKNNIDKEKQSVWDEIIYKYRCPHIIHTINGITKICNIKLKNGYQYCKKHLPKEKVLCKINVCTNRVKITDEYCRYHNPKKVIAHIDFKFKLNKVYDYINNYFDYTNLNSFYRLKIYVRNIPIIVEHKCYFNINVFDNKQIIKYFDIKQYFYNIYLIFKKYNIKYNFNNLKMEKKNSNTKKY